MYIFYHNQWIKIDVIKGWFRSLQRRFLGRGEGTAPTIGHAHKFFRLRLLRNELDMPALINTTVSSITVLVCCSKQPRVLAARRLFPDVQIYSIAHRSMANSRKVLCPLFDEFEILMRGDSPSIFPSVDKMWNFNSLWKRRKMIFSGCAKALCPFYSSTKVLKMICKGFVVI